MAVVLLPLPAADVDPTESGVPWRTLSERGHHVVVATPDGRPAQADPRMLTGRGLGPFAPFLVADRHGREAYRAMAASREFAAPLPWEAIAALAYDALLLPGGHAPGMRPYLESPLLQRAVAESFAAGKPVAAICHGVVLAARSRRTDGRSVLHGRRTTALPRRMELAAWWLTRAWLGSYYRTYPVTVEGEVTEALAAPAHFERGPASLRRDAPGQLDRGFTVRDGHYLSARWPGDAHRLAAEFAAML
ncbi:MAG: DJ-1/PfpI family protein [Holophagales bacterium]|nr:MAG: DJ-1/PfpI family protein [Holophagales bacterium]